MKKGLVAAILVIIVLAISTGVLYAQQGGKRGAIKGVVYEDVNGDGRCVDTGVPGEGPVMGIDIEMVSSDGETVLTYYTGEGGIYHPVALGYSYWTITAKPGPEWVVTSERTRVVAVYEDTRSHTGVDFCVRRRARHPGFIGYHAQKGRPAMRPLLPESGAADTGLDLTVMVFLVGFIFVGTGLGLELKRRMRA